MRAVTTAPADAVAAFLRAVRRGDTITAGRFLDVPAELEARAPELARRLAVVLTHRLGDHIATISKAASGNLDDKLPPNFEQLGVLPTSRYGEQAVRMHREASPTFGWVFTRSTVEYIDDWYERLPARWIVEYLPPAFDVPAVAGLTRWQVLALPMMIALALLLAIACSRLSRGAARRLAADARSPSEGALLERYRGPITLVWFVAWSAVLKSVLVLPVSADAVGDRLIRIGGLLALFWAMERSIGVIRDRIAAWPGARLGEDATLPLLTRSLKIAVLLVAMVTMLAEIGYPVTSMVVGLAIVVFAIAAVAGRTIRKTLENLFGGFVIGADQPFREGDFVKIDNCAGTVESVGLRSTRIRTLDRALITVPNGRIADARIESYSARDGLCLSTVISLDRMTTATQMHTVLDGLDRILYAEPQVVRDGIVVRFAKLGVTSLDVEVMARFHSMSWDEFQLVRHSILLKFMDVIAKAGTSFAFPASDAAPTRIARAP